MSNAATSVATMGVNAAKVQHLVGIVSDAASELSPYYIVE
jgi:hypothetical protein